jgi:DNA repair exonuclease SbcCD ATPase subunit
MRNEKFVYVFLVLICSFLILFYFWGLRKEYHLAREEKNASSAAVGRMQIQLKELAEIRDSLKKSEALFKEELKKEREKVLYLDEKLKKSISQSRSLAVKISQSKIDRKLVEDLQRRLEELSLKNEVLKEGFDDARKKFELIEPIKNKLSGVESELGALEIKKGRDELLSVQLDSISRELNSVNNYMLQLLENNISPIRLYADLTQKSQVKLPEAALPDVSKYQEEIDKLRARFDLSQKEQTLLKQQFQDAQLQLEQNNKELNARAEKIFTLQEKVMAMENSVFEMRTTYKEMEKDAAVLREKYVAVELEKSSLQIALDQSRQELGQLQGKFLSLLGRIGGIFKSSEEVQVLKDGQKSNPAKGSKIDVELIPQETKE